MGHCARRNRIAAYEAVVFVCVWALAGAIAPGAAASDEAIVLGVGDTIQIHVAGVQELDKEVKVPDEGVFAYPPIGMVQGRGRTAREIEEEITNRLADGYVKDPTVAVIIVDTASKNVMVIGAVHKPGPVNTSSGVSMLELLSLVNGLSENASKEAIVVRGRFSKEGEKETVRMSLTELLGGDVEKNTTLYPGDVVIFPSISEAVDKINVLGAVRNPGSFPLAKGVTIVDFIAQAGGPTPTAGDVVMIIRAAKNREADSKAAPMSYELQKILSGDQGTDIEFKSGDTIMLPSSTDLQMSFFIIGQVRSPGMYPWRDGMTVLNAISVAGGLTDKATTSNLQIIKDGGAGTRPPVTANTSYRIERGDTIYISEGWF